MKHEHVTDRLSQYLDDSLDAAGRARVEQHLGECAACLGVLRDLEAVVAAAADLGPIEPPRDLWAGVQMGMERVGDPLRVESGASQLRPPPRRMVSIPKAVAAAVLVSIVSAGSAWWVAARTSAGSTPASVAEVADSSGPFLLVSDVVPEELSQELRLLEATLQRSAEEFEPNTRRILERNLAIIDRAIRESLEALAAEPSDPFLEDHLEAQLRRKVRVLRNATGLSAD